MSRDHEPLVIREFNGQFARGEDDSVPADHFRDSRNLIYKEGGCETRPGTSLYLSTNVSGSPNIVRLYSYKRTGEADRLLILFDNGTLYDSLSLVSPILTVVGMIDCSVVVMFGRAYITPHNRNKGLAGSFVYVYNGSGVARKAAGFPPTGFAIAGIQGSAGKIEKGKHVIGIVFETDSGFLTKPGPENALFTYDALVKNFQVNLSFSSGSVPVGPAGTVARHFVASRTQPANWNGDTKNVELFFVDAYKINHNNPVAQPYAIDFYDSDLVRSADYLLDNVSEIPAFLGMTNYQGSLVGWAQDTQEAVAWVSKSGQPEAISSVEGFISVDPGDGGPLRNCWVHRGQLHMQKSYTHYVTQSNGAAPSTWQVLDIDEGYGTEVFGVSQLMDRKGKTMDRFILATRIGLVQFVGTYAEKELSWKIENIWKRINPAVFNLVYVLQDPHEKRVYVGVPLDGAGAVSHLLVCDYSNGWEPLAVKWDIWELGVGLVPRAGTLILDSATLRSIFLFTGGIAKIFKFDATIYTDGDLAIGYNTYFKTGYLGPDDGYINHYSEIRMRVKGSGTLIINVYGLEQSAIAAIPSMTVVAAPAKEYTRLINCQAEGVTVVLQHNAAGHYFKFNRIRLFFRRLWNSRLA